jgi:hypothetical protein
MGSTNSAGAEVKRLFFPEHWRRAVEPDATARDRFAIARLICSAKCHSLDQIDRDRRPL